MNIVETVPNSDHLLSLGKRMVRRHGLVVLKARIPQHPEKPTRLMAVTEDAFHAAARMLWESFPGDPITLKWVEAA